ncbi:LysR family transcriptional regulator [Halomonas sp. D1-1]|uniref:LysR family transcriptional regulator n=1 Tax=Halomonas icarae TaxID=2691040 RepID=A0A7X4VW26_9GAMM|nr:LysR family transcriptional regulator [Halomonas icarae]
MSPESSSMQSLIVFEATVRLGSMSAADAERTSQPTTSLRIRTLEERVELPLFDRQEGPGIPERQRDGLNLSPRAWPGPRAPLPESPPPGVARSADAGRPGSRSCSGRCPR